MSSSLFARCVRGAGSARGFTLIETLIAMLIAAIGAAMVLSHVRTLMLRTEREQAHQLAALQLLNDSLRVAHGGPPQSAPYLERDALVIEGSQAEAWPTVRVWNFSPSGQTLPPISIAYTPFQLFGVSRDRYTLHAIGPGLKTTAAKGASVTANSPAAGQP